jgi:hypothetical protein
MTTQPIRRQLSARDHDRQVAVEYSILTAVRHMLTYDVDYHDLGGDYFTRR